MTGATSSGSCDTDVKPQALPDCLVVARRGETCRPQSLMLMRTADWRHILMTEQCERLKTRSDKRWIGWRRGGTSEALEPIWGPCDAKPVLSNRQFPWQRGAAKVPCWQMTALLSSVLVLRRVCVCVCYLQVPVFAVGMEEREKVCVCCLCGHTHNTATH